jgi:Flp pilus assembly protein TadG
MMARGRLSDQRGLVGKILVVWLLILALFVVASIDTITILYSRFKVADAAQSASFDAASAYKSTRSRTEAEKAAIATIQATAPGARLVSLVIDPATGAVTHEGVLDRYLFAAVALSTGLRLVRARRGLDCAGEDRTPAHRARRAIRPRGTDRT